MYRGRRLRKNENMRRLVRETKVSKSSLIYPIFIEEGENINVEIQSMPGQYRISPDNLVDKLKEIKSWGIDSVILFGVPKHKDEKGSGAYHDHGIVQEALRIGKANVPDMTYIADVCMCEYTSHGHCGIVDENDVDNDETLKYLQEIALSQVRAGADIVAPSDMMDGRVEYIRKALDENGFSHTPIMSYSVKYASCFYGPFREAAGSDGFKGNRKTYQMDFYNRKEALREAEADILEETDMLIVKPALSYLDIIRDVRENTNIPIVAYSVSGEYSMIKLAGQQGLVDEQGMIKETTVSMFRAGADMLITYFAKEICQMIDRGEI